MLYRSRQGPGLVNLSVLAMKLGRFTKANVPAQFGDLLEARNHLIVNEEYLFQSSLEGFSPMDRERTLSLPVVLYPNKWRFASTIEIELALCLNT